MPNLRKIIDSVHSPSKPPGPPNGETAPKALPAPHLKGRGSLIKIEKPDGNMMVILAERHSLFSPEPFGEFFISAHQAGIRHGGQYSPLGPLIYGNTLNPITSF